MNVLRFLPFAASLLLFVAPTVSIQAQGVTTPGSTVPATFLEYRTTVPAGWVASTPSSSMRLAEYRVPATGSAIPVEIVVYFFGPGQGGSSQANLDRWKSQFSNPAGGDVAETVRRDTTGAFPLTVAEYSGTYARGTGAGSAPDAARPGHKLIAVVAETPRGTLFFQCFGPVAAVDAQRAVYLQFVRGLR
ncbi:hypothetical protein [Gemmatimonas sp.]|jgi:hypothetical protein|uniref:hypothetical protein n=1 Tax=Gemmatimonas sp. TaxID=1962908 RepID=UPI0037C15A54